MPEPEADAIRRHVEKIVASEGFANAERLRRFLTFIVEAKLRGDADQIKEYVLGREVFDRNEQYDPRLDPIVRVEARRLRAKLAEYYSGSGAGDPIRIELRKGRYVPEIRRADEVAAVAPSRSRRWILASVALLAAIAAGTYLWRHFARDLTGLVAVIPAGWVWTERDEQPAAAEAVAEAVAAELANGGAVSVVAWPAMVRFRGTGKSPRQIASEAGASQALIVSVRKDGPNRLTAFLFDANTDRKLWVGDYFPRDLSSIEGRREAALTLAREMADATRQRAEGRSPLR